MKSDESLSLIQKEFFECRCDETGNVAQHISKLEQMASKMKMLGGEIPTSVLIMRILSTLPSKFSHFHSAWDSTDGAKRTIENLTARFMAEELRMKGKDEPEETTALLSKMNLTANATKKFGNSKEMKDIGRKRRDGFFTCGKRDHKLQRLFQLWIKELHREELHEK